MKVSGNSTAVTNRRYAYALTVISNAYFELKISFKVLIDDYVVIKTPTTRSLQVRYDANQRLADLKWCFYQPQKPTILSFTVL